MKQSTPTLCSLSLCFWGYQTGAWIIAIPMALALEAREMVKQRWSLSRSHLKCLHIAAIFLWLVAVFFLPPISPAAIPYAARYHLIKCLPVGLFPLVLAQTYCVNFVSIYRQYLGNIAKSWRTIDWYYPYFGICLIAASATGGNLFVFLAITAVLVALFLGTLQWPVNRKLSLRFTQSTFYGLIVLALVLSLIGTHQFYWLQANMRLPGPAVFGDFIQKMARIWPDDRERGFREEVDRLLEDIELETETDTTVSARTRNGDQNSHAPSNFDTPSNTSSQNGDSSTPNTATQETQDTGNVNNLNTNTDTGASSPPTSNHSVDQVDQDEGTNNDADSTPPSPEPDPNADVSQLTENTSTPEIPAPSPTQNTGPSPPSNISELPSNSGQGRRNPGQTKAPRSSQQTQLGRNDGQSLPSLVQRSGGIVDPEKTQTQIGNIGSLQRSNAILFGVAPHQKANSPQPQFPLYIREATYNQYQSGTWNAIKPKFTTKRPQSNRQSWSFGTKTNRTTSVRISAKLPRKDGLLKLPLGTSEVNQLQVRTLQENQYGTVAIQGKPGPLAYTVQFDPKQSLDSPPTALDKAIPAAEKPTLKKILNSLNLEGKSDAEIASTISAFYKKQGFQYSLDLPKPKNNKTPIAAFLLDHRSGHCEYYASATSLLLRAAGVPTRYAVGYTAHEYSPTEQQYIVRLKDAHAWVLAYVDNAWVKVDTTPGGGITPDRNTVTETAQNGHTQEGNTSTQDGNSSQDRTATQNGIPSEDGSSTEGNNKLPSKSFLERLSELWSELMTQLSKNSETLLWAGLMIVLGLGTVIGSIYLIWSMIRKKRSQQSKKRRHQKLDRSRQPITDGLDSEFYLIEKRLGDWGLGRRPSETVRQWLGRLEQELSDSYMRDLHQIIDLHYRYRFDPQGLAPKDREQLKAMIQSWLNEFGQL